jgi:hypothetical protein
MSLEVQAPPITLGDERRYSALATVIYDGYNHGMGEFDIDSSRSVFNALLGDAQDLYDALASGDPRALEKSTGEIMRRQADMSPLTYARIGSLTQRFIADKGKLWTPRGHFDRGRSVHPEQLFMGVGAAFRANDEALRQVDSCARALGELRTFDAFPWVTIDKPDDIGVFVGVERRLHMAARATIRSLAIPPEDRSRLIYLNGVIIEGTED